MKMRVRVDVFNEISQTDFYFVHGVFRSLLGQMGEDNFRRLISLLPKVSVNIEENKFDS